MDRLDIQKLVILGLLLVIITCGMVLAEGVREIMLPVPIAVMPPAILIEPARIVQGDPVMVVITGVSGEETSSISVKSIAVDGKAFHIVDYDMHPTVFIAEDFNGKIGTSTVSVVLADGTLMKKNFVVYPHKKIEAPLGIPARLGGDTLTAETTVVMSLASENAILSKLKSATTTYWTEGFQFPVADPIVTDMYGYTRQTGPYQIVHKGTDFKAPPGTAVMAVNTGKVILAAPFGLYGNTVVIDHGGGIMSFYMHLSEIDVNVADMVTRGEVIGKSGETGYAEGPHLHLTIRVNGISIDPMQFLQFF